MRLRKKYGTTDARQEKRQLRAAASPAGMPRDPLRRAAGRVPRASPQLFCEKDLLWLLGKSVPLVEAVCRNGPLGQKNDLRDAPFPDQLLHLGQELGAEAASLPLRLDAELLDPILRARAPVFDAPQGDADEAACLIESPGERAAAGERSRTYRQSCSSDQTSFQGSPEKISRISRRISGACAVVSVFTSMAIPLCMNVSPGSPTVRRYPGGHL